MYSSMGDDVRSMCFYVRIDRRLSVLVFSRLWARLNHRRLSFRQPDDDLTDVCLADCTAAISGEKANDGSRESMVDTTHLSTSTKVKHLAHYGNIQRENHVGFKSISSI